MWPIGTYERFLRKIKGQENYGEKVNYYGVLFCDVRQSKAKEYILNYLDVFNCRSGKFIDFYIPGYISGDEFYKNKSDQEKEISISNKRYIFYQDEYRKFCTAFEKDFDVEFPFSSTLVLMEYKKGDFSTARKMIFELEDRETGIKSAGRLFLKIFKCAEDGEMGVTLDQLSKSLSAKAKAGMMVAGGKSVLNFFGVDIEPVINQCQEIIRFRIQ